MTDGVVPTEQREGIERSAFVGGEEVSFAEAVATAAGWFAAATSIVALTGAGISTDSGIPDFRGRNGVWTRNPEAEKASTIEHYMSSTEVRARAWQMRRASPAWSAQPNAGHRALVDLERQGHLSALVTQNIDGLHLIAGSSPERLIEVHGSMRGVRCTGCGERTPMEVVLARVEGGESDPSCLSCGGILKSTTVLFGEALDPAHIDAAEAAARRCDLLVAVGSTLGVYPIAILPTVAVRSGARLVIVNGGPTEQDDVADAVIRGSISEILPALVGGSPA